MKKTLITAIVFLTVALNLKIAYSTDVITKEALIKKIQSFFKKNKTITGHFTLIRGPYVERGIFFYKSPNKFKMVFGYNQGFKILDKTILSNGKQLYVYLPSLKVVIDQDIKRATGNIAYAGSGYGIRRLIRKYKYEFLNNDNSLKTVAGLTEKVRILKLYRSKSFSGFKEILLFVREDGFIVKSQAITNKGKIIQLIRTNVKLNVEIDNKHFVFRVPKDAQIIRNPLVSGG